MDDVSWLVWRDHLLWVAEHEQRRVDQERWTDQDWERARALADAEWTHRPYGLYIYEAERALRQCQYERGAARLEAQARGNGRVQRLVADDGRGED